MVREEIEKCAGVLSMVLSSRIGCSFKHFLGLSRRIYYGGSVNFDMSSTVPGHHHPCFELTWCERVLWCPVVFSLVWVLMKVLIYAENGIDCYLPLCVSTIC